MRTFRIFLVAMALVLTTQLSFGAPTPSKVAGTVANGQPVTVTGSGFGVNAAAGTTGIEWLGGPTGNIASGTIGKPFTKTNWQSIWAENFPTYESDFAHSGTKSIRAIVYPATDWDSDMTFHLPASLAVGQTLYASWWVRTSRSGAGQWKMLRMENAPTFVDGDMELVFFDWLGVNAPQMVIDPGTGTDQTTWVNNSDYPTSDSIWYRQELIINTAGSVVINLYQPNNTLASQTVTGLKFNGPFNYLVWQNYAGNGITAFTAWFDDIFIQEGTQARMEICDSPTWNARTTCEIQYPTTWNDSSISATINQGGFGPTDSKYLYVVDATGAANSAGYPVTFGGGGTAAPVNGSCGSDSGKTLPSLSSTDPNLCAGGTPTAFHTTATLDTWGCSGLNGGTNTLNTACSATISSATLPVINTFTIATTSTSLTVPITAFTVTGATNYCVNTTNASSSCTWTTSPPTSVTFGAAGNVTAYAFAENATGTTSANANTVITLPVTGAVTGVVNGVCGSDNKRSFSSLSSTDKNLCSEGTVASFKKKRNSYTWKCMGTDGGENASCSAIK